MKLLTKLLIRKFPPLESTDEENPGNIKIPCKFFLPGTMWTWWPFEYDGIDTFFGLVRGEAKELGYFTLEQLRQRKGQMGMRVERDKFFS
ncbi:unnamed protein product, partial [marine sediment metagenome]